MTYRSVCTGIAAETVAWHPLGFTALSFSEINLFCNALLKFRYPDIPNYGDFTRFAPQGVHTPDTDILMGGTPCQSFSVAGKRAGLDDPRGNLAIEFARLAERLRPRWIVWENVKGVLSQAEGRAFATFLWALEECGYGFAYRVLDAQFDGLAQRRQRVFVVGYLGDWRPPAAVLFERESLRRDLAPRRKTGQEVAGTIANCIRGSGPGGPRVGDSRGQDTVVAMALNAHGGSGRIDGESGGVAVSFTQRRREGGRNLETQEELAYTLRNPGEGGGGGSLAQVSTGAAVRRLTPMEWERLMGLPDLYTLIPYPRKKLAADGPRYKAIGNSISVPTLRWVGQRIAKVDGILTGLLNAKESVCGTRK